MIKYLYTGDGGGKSCNALGIALRSLAHGKKVLIVQFLKWNKKTGEYLIQDKIEGLTVKQFGRDGWHGLGNLNEQDRSNCLAALEYIYTYLREQRVDLIILDEINIVAFTGLLTIKEITNFIDILPKHINIVMTGRYAPQELIDYVDIANSIEEIKAPTPMLNIEGINY